ncbi:MAG: hypothetical protein JJE09_02225 [Bacteroidia bacterium]|nr:hypothetical protein [Bacteroidia bacterium]
MNRCEFEKRIYLYRELTSVEKEITDVHIAQCQSCSELATRVFQEQNLISNIGSSKFSVKNSQQLTQRIMNSIERAEKSTSGFNGLITFLDSLFVRYAFSALSILLITFFYMEQQHEGHKAQTINKIEVNHGSILNTSSFLKAHQKRREDKEKTISASRYSYNRSERIVKTL